MQDENFHCKPDSPIPETICNGCSICKPYDDHAKEIWDSSLPQTYQPEIWQIKKDLVYKLIPALEAGIEHTTENLCNHDASLGRTTRKNKEWAETIEKDIRDMEDCLAQLKLLSVRLGVVVL